MVATSAMRPYLKIALSGWLFVATMATSAGADPPPPPGCRFICGTITPIKDPSLGIPFAEPESNLGPPWVSYRVDLYALELPNPDLPNSRTMSFDVAISGQLHQRWSDIDGDGVFVATPNDLSISDGDSHLLATSDAVFASTPIEDNSRLGSPLNDTPTFNYGVGTTLQGAWTYLNVSEVTNLTYIVVPKGSPLDITVHWAFPADPQGTLRTSDFIWIPEPASAFLAAIALGGFQLTIGRRRRP